jgi:trigger factor
MPDTKNTELENTDPSVNAEAEAEQRLDLQVQVDNRSTCERHVTVTVSRADIDRYFDKEFTELMPLAHVPGFRPGHAPRKLVENRFRKDMAEKVKGELLMNSLTQVNEDQKLSAISEPDFDFEAVELPAEGPLTFEFDIEVRPEFELPQWKGLKIEKPTREVSADDVEHTLQGILARRGRLAPHDGPAAAGDFLTVNITFQNGDEVVSSAEEKLLGVRSTLSFRDGNVEDFDKLMEGVRAGETREGEIALSDDAPNASLRGKKLKTIFEVLEVKRLEMPELTPELLEELGGFTDAADLRDAIRDQLARQLEYEQRQRARGQITAALTVAADWELPPALLQRQSRRELQRAVMELQRSGFADDAIQAHENALRQNSLASTAKALKEHFILERIAEEENIDAVDQDYEDEIHLIAAQSDESPRRVRARLEKSGSMDVLRNQIIERKVIDLILENAKFQEVPYEFQRPDESAVDFAAGGGEQSDIPAAKYDEAEAVPEAQAEGQNAKVDGKKE